MIKLIRKNNIRRARLNDIEDIIKIWEDGLNDAFGANTESFENKESLKSHFEKFINNKNANFGFWVYCDLKDKSIAFCSLTPFHSSPIWTNNFGFLSLYVLGEYQNKFFGFRLLKYVLDFTIQTDLHYILSTIVSDNHRIKKLSKKLGYKEFSQLPRSKNSKSFPTVILMVYEV